MKLDLDDCVLANKWLVADYWGIVMATPYSNKNYFFLSALAAAFFSTTQSSAKDQYNSGTWRQPMIFFQYCARKDSGTSTDKAIDKQGLGRPLLKC